MSELFKQVIRDNGIPTEADELSAAFRQIAVDERVTFNNDSNYSPFWRLITALVTKPVLWLLGLLTHEILPNLFLKTATGKWVDLYSWSVSIERKLASKAMGEITLTRYETLGELEIPKGVVIQTHQINGKVYRVISREAMRFEAGKSILKVIVEADEVGAAYNLADGFYTVVVDSNLSGLIQSVNADNWLLVPGTDEETDADLKLRARNQFTAVNRWHIDSTYKAMIAGFNGINIDEIYIEHDAPRGAGTANAYILFDVDAPADEYLATIDQYINTDGNHGFGDDLRCFAMPSYLVSNALSIWLAPNLSTDQIETIKTNVDAFVRTAFRELLPDAYQPTLTHPNQRFSWSKLTQELHGTFPEIQDMDFEKDQSLLNGLNIPELDEFTVTVQ